MAKITLITKQQSYDGELGVHLTDKHIKNGNLNEYMLDKMNSKRYRRKTGLLSQDEVDECIRYR